MLRVMLEKNQHVEHDKKAIIDYLKNGAEVAAAPGFVRDQITKDRTHIAIYAYSDGVFEWTSHEIYHVEKYNYKLPQLFLDHIRRCIQ